jgi:hypothetical protein
MPEMDGFVAFLEEFEKLDKKTVETIFMLSSTLE